jgi:hypothetical protein
MDPSGTANYAFVINLKPADKVMQNGQVDNNISNKTS